MNSSAVPAPAATGPETGAVRRRDRLVTLGGMAAIAAAGLGGAVLFPEDLAFLTRVATAALLVLSLDLVTGYCGIATLGHAALFGAGAYAAGIAAAHGGIGDPVALLALGALGGAAAGLVSGIVILRANGLPQLVLSIAVVQLAGALANKLSGWTGGSDGLSGISPKPLFDAFEFDLYGRTGYWLGIVLLVLVFGALRIVVRSPFGLLCRGIREDETRVRALGARVRPALVAMYAISGLVAGLGGALSAVTTGVVGLDSLGFERSATALVMLVFGGSGTLSGALIGTLVFQVFEHVVSAANPFHWLTLVGLLLIAVVLFLPGGLQKLAFALPFPSGGRRSGEPGRPEAPPTGRVVRDAPPTRIQSRRHAEEELAPKAAASAPLLSVQGLEKSFGGLRVSQGVSLSLGPGDRLALIGPNGAGKTTFINLVTGALRPDDGRIVLGGQDVTGLGVEARVRRGLVRTFQISRLFRDMTVIENVLLTVLQREGRTSRMLPHAGADPALEHEAAAILDRLGLAPVSGRLVREIAYGQQRLVEIAIAVALRPRVLLLDEPAAGVSRAEAPRIVEAIDSLPSDIAVLMIEHDMDLVLRFARRVVVLASGTVIFDGSPADVVSDARVREAYLGNYASERA